MSRAHRVLSPNEREPVANGRCALAIMTKVPQPGRVKTRLSPPLTPEECAELNRCFLRDTAAAIAAADGRAQGVACYTPVGEEEAYRDILPQSFQLIPQHSGDFGERLRRATEDLFAVGFSAVCLIDSDSPTVSSPAFAAAVEVLLQPNEKLVLGPSDDGGYYLIGLQRPHRRVFEEIDWSTERVLDQTLQRAAEERLSVHLLAPGYDVDDAVSLQRLAEELFGPNESRAVHTRQFLRELTGQDARARLWPEEFAVR